MIPRATWTIEDRKYLSEMLKEGESLSGAALAFKEMGAFGKTSVVTVISEVKKGMTEKDYYLKKLPLYNVNRSVYNSLVEQFGKNGPKYISENINKILAFDKDDSNLAEEIKNILDDKEDESAIIEAKDRVFIRFGTNKNVYLTQEEYLKLKNMLSADDFETLIEKYSQGKYFSEVDFEGSDYEPLIKFGKRIGCV